jgi:hypothetical protein
LSDGVCKPDVFLEAKRGMSEVWLRTNRRAVLLGMIVPLVLVALGASLLLAVDHDLARLLGALALALGGVLLVLLGWQLRQPRLAYDRGELLFYLRTGGPIRAPIEVVECFLLGQAETMLAGKQHERSEARAVVAKLSDKAEEWSHLSVKPALGKWCDGYVTIRGTWCEPLDIGVINRLNRRLAEVQSALRDRRVTP